MNPMKYDASVLEKNKGHNTWSTSRLESKFSWVSKVRCFEIILSMKIKIMKITLIETITKNTNIIPVEKRKNERK